MSAVPRLLARVVAGAALGCSAVAAMASPASGDCDIVDLMPAFWQSIDAGDAATRLRDTIVDRHPDLYNADYVSLPSGDAWATMVANERVYADAHAREIEAADAYLASHAAPTMRRFRTTFPDFRCDFTFYIAPSFGRMDGSAAFVNGQHRIIFAPDVIPRYHSTSELKVLVDHESFHIYHHQATGRFGASAEAVPTVIEALWSEGLATFVSWRMNDTVGLDTALLQPGIPDAAKPHLASIAQDLLRHLDDKDEATYLHYFVAGRQPDGLPPRAGYYVGMLIARELSASRTLQQLAHLDGPALRTAVAGALGRYASGELPADVPLRPMRGRLRSRSPQATPPELSSR